MALTHGGNLAEAAAAFGLKREHWLDISTGISPWLWPIPALPQAVWNRLPEKDGHLELSAAIHYGCPQDEILAVPGSQYAISHIPRIIPTGPTALPFWGYREHLRAWQQAGHSILYYRDADQLSQLVTTGSVRHAVVINPCNPTAELMQAEQLVQLAAELNDRDGHLVVDEAFMDATPEYSLAHRRPDNACIFRSLGKFYGLAGLRLGFVLADREWLERLEADMDPWAVSHPARWIGARALADQDWQSWQRQRLAKRSRQWQDSLSAVFPGRRLKRSALFTTMCCNWRTGRHLYHSAGSQGLLLRLMEPQQDETLLRFGLPPDHQRKEALVRLIRAAKLFSTLPGN